VCGLCRFRPHDRGCQSVLRSNLTLSISEGLPTIHPERLQLGYSATIFDEHLTAQKKSPQRARKRSAAVRKLKMAAVSSWPACSSGTMSAIPGKTCSQLFAHLYFGTAAALTSCEWRGGNIALSRNTTGSEPKGSPERGSGLTDARRRLPCPFAAACVLPPLF